MTPTPTHKSSLDRITHFREFDIVELIANVDDPHDGYFGAGAVGAIVGLGSGYVLVEVVRPDGTTAGLLDLLPSQVRRVHDISRPSAS
jgi:hypothetical protein